MPFELVMKTDLQKAIPQAIEFNYDELKKQLPERLAYYKNLVVTEDSIKSAKADKATLFQSTLPARGATIEEGRV